VSGFLLNMINRHQGLVDKVKPRMRSLFEPESAPAFSSANAFSSTADKQSGDTGYEKQSRFPKSPSIEKSVPENPSSLSVMFQQSAGQSEQGLRSHEPHTFNSDRMDLMNEPIQSVLARLDRKSESTQNVSAPNGRHSMSPEASDQTTSKVVSNEMGLSSRIEETLKRLKNQTSQAVEGHHRGLQDPARPTDGVKIEAVASPAQPKIKHQQTAESDDKSINHQAQASKIPINKPEGAFQIPDWLTGLQTDINNRWREINAQPHAEPIVNVTIGRVEVRATNTEFSKPTAAQKKPSGVLSLDDYLKQLENKRRP